MTPTALAKKTWKLLESLDQRMKRIEDALGLEPATPAKAPGELSGPATDASPPESGKGT